MNRTRRLCGARVAMAAALAFTLAFTPSQAQPLAPIRIGQTAGYTGIVAPGVREAAEGARLYLESVNAAGGIGGRSIELVSLDDQFDPRLAALNAKKLIDQGVLALFLTRGTPQNQAIMPLLLEHKLPLVAPSTGAMMLHEPVHPWVFNVRASYQREAERAVLHLNLIGLERVAVLQVDDAFGTDAAVGALKGFGTLQRAPVLHEKFNRAKPDYPQLMQKVVQSNAQAVLFLASGTVVVEGVAQLRAAGSPAQVVTLSNNASAGFVKALERHAHGVIVCQVFPDERSVGTPMIKEAHELARAQGIEDLSPSMLEGFAAAKVLVEGLRRAGKDATRESLQKALEGFRQVDIGGLEVSYSPTDHTGLDYADVSIIGSDGRFKR